MNITILTLFPEMVQTPLLGSLLGKAIAKGILAVDVVDIRTFSEDRHRTVDDVPYGGGQGMVLKPEPVVKAIEDSRERNKDRKGHRVLLMTPQGKPFRQRKAQELSECQALTLVCGRYEGVDERIRPFVDDEVSIGDFVLSGGEFAALVVVDAVARLIPGVLGNEVSFQQDSFCDGLLEHPQYTRPRCFRELEVPAILLSGDHGAIAKWRRRASLLRTKERRPDLFEELELSQEDRLLIEGAEP